MNRYFAFGAVLVIIIGAVIGGFFGRLTSKTSADSSVTTQSIVSDYTQAIDVIDKSYVGSVDHEKISDTSIQGMLWTLDPHSSFFTKDEFRKLNEEQSSQFYGIGVSILQHHDGVYVQSIIPGTPADKAGLRYGDRFVTIEGKDATEWTSSEVSKNVRGERGTPVKLSVERAGGTIPQDFELVRDGVPLPSIRSYFMLPDGVGYVGLSGGFQETTASELDDAMAQLKKQGMKSLILDLRNNPGGLLPEAIEVVSRFIPKDKAVVAVKGRASYAKSQELRSRGGNTNDLPLAIMINGGTASASEIVSGALQDYDRALIVGTESFGKGLVQRVMPMPYGTGLTLTIARYYTPFGRSLQRDYSSGSIYDYYSHQEAASDENTGEPKPTPAGTPIPTANGRLFYGGQGIDADIEVLPTKYNALLFRLNEAAFYFTRQLVAGKIAGFENYRTSRQDQILFLQPDEFPISDKLFEAFRTFTAGNKESGLTAENIDSEVEFAKARIRQEIATAKHSNEAGVQVLLESDPQILKAIESMPEASKMAAAFAASN